MEFETNPLRDTPRRAFLAAALVVAGMSAAWAQPAGAGRSQIYTCDVGGRKITSDKLITGCTGEQRILNSDGSLRGIVPPTLTADERAEREAREREAIAERVARQDAIRRDRNLMLRFKDEAEHNKAREKALDDIRKSVKLSETRVTALIAERKKLMDEAEFYVGKSMPSRLRFGLDANEASLGAQRSLIQNQQAEVGRIDSLYDAELARLKKLWAGAPAGSLGPPPGPTPAPGAQAPQPRSAAATKVGAG
ncbi:MAG: hypothetical protein ABI641_01350 [Caldimonas sp.]